MDTSAKSLCKSSEEGQGGHHIKKLGNAGAESTGAWVDGVTKGYSLRLYFKDEVSGKSPEGQKFRNDKIRKFFFVA